MHFFAGMPPKKVNEVDVAGAQLGSMSLNSSSASQKKRSAVKSTSLSSSEKKKPSKVVKGASQTSSSERKIPAGEEETAKVKATQVVKSTAAKLLPELLKCQQERNDAKFALLEARERERTNDEVAEAHEVLKEAERSAKEAKQAIEEVKREMRDVMQMAEKKMREAEEEMKEAEDKMDKANQQMREAYQRMREANQQMREAEEKMNKAKQEKLAAKETKEGESGEEAAYGIALAAYKSILDSYTATVNAYVDAVKAHTPTVNAHINAGSRFNKDWNNAASKYSEAAAREKLAWDDWKKKVDQIRAETGTCRKRVEEAEEKIKRCLSEANAALQVISPSPSCFASHPQMLGALNVANQRSEADCYRPSPLMGSRRICKMIEDFKMLILKEAPVQEGDHRLQLMLEQWVEFCVGPDGEKLRNERLVRICKHFHLEMKPYFYSLERQGEGKPGKRGLNLRSCSGGILVEMKGEKCGVTAEPLTEAIMYFEQLRQLEIQQKEEKQMEIHKQGDALLLEVVGPDIIVHAAVWDPSSDTIHTQRLISLFLCKESLHVVRCLFTALASFEREPDPEHSYPDRVLSGKGKVTWDDRKPCAIQGNDFLKFSDSYGSEVHQALADAGLAPELKQLITSPAVGQVVESWCIKMAALHDYVSLYDYFHNIEVEILLNSKVSLDREELEAFCSKVLDVLGRGHFVHGDLRAPNIMMLDPRKPKNAKTDLPKLMVVDFDWAGEEGKVCYPLNLSDRIRWPTGVRSGAVITHAHDEESLRMMCAELFPPEGANEPQLTHSDSDLIRVE